jgi:tetratricopeptide (TPR) repeat protein
MHITGAMNAPPSFTGSPTAAYRADMDGRGRPFGPKDALWLAAASELHLSATAKSQIPQRQHLLEALSMAIDIVGDEAIDRYVNREWFGKHSFHEALVVLADQIIDAEAYGLGAVILMALLIAIPRLKPLERGRIMALRARIAWRTSDMDDARERYEDIAKLGLEGNEKELEARAAVGLAAVAQLRGNMPAVREHSVRAIEVGSEIGHRSLERWGHNSLTMAAAKAGDYTTAIKSAWRAFELARGDAISEAEALSNVGQILLEAGDAEVARQCFTAVLARQAQVGVLFTSLGGLARASAALRAEVTVEWCVREVWRGREVPAGRYHLCEALLESAMALGQLGRGDEAERFRAASYAMAQTNGFYELEFRAERLEADVHTLPTPRSGYANVVSAIQELEPERLPDQIAFETAPV